jgi:hypothetical protein
LWGKGGMGFFVFWKEIRIREGLGPKLTQRNTINPLWFFLLY